MQFVEFANCTFTEDASFKGLLEISAEHEALIEEFGYGGYGVHYLRPYRGFKDDYPYDMVRMVHWYNRDKRAENIEKYQAMRKFMADRGMPDKYAQHIKNQFEDYSFQHFKNIDEDGWPHYEVLKNLEELSPSAQEILMKKSIINYFK